MVIFHSYVKLPEGTCIVYTIERRSTDIDEKSRRARSYGTDPETMMWTIETMGVSKT